MVANELAIMVISHKEVKLANHFANSHFSMRHVALHMESLLGWLTGLGFKEEKRVRKMQRNGHALFGARRNLSQLKSSPGAHCDDSQYSRLLPGKDINPRVASIREDVCCLVPYCKTLQLSQTILVLVLIYLLCSDLVADNQDPQFRGA